MPPLTCMTTPPTPGDAQAGPHGVHTGTTPSGVDA